MSKMLRNPKGECILCGEDISHKKITALYCDSCKKESLKRSYRESKRKKRGYYKPKVCLNCEKTIERTLDLKYWNGYCLRCR